MDSRWLRPNVWVWVVLLAVVVAIGVDLLNHSSSSSTPIGEGQLLQDTAKALQLARTHPSWCAVKPCVTLTQTGDDSLNFDYTSRHG